MLQIHYCMAACSSIAKIGKANIGKNEGHMQDKTFSHQVFTGNLPYGGKTYYTVGVQYGEVLHESVWLRKITSYKCNDSPYFSPAPVDLIYTLQHKTDHRIEPQ